MSGRPAVDGAVQLTVRLSSVALRKVGAAGASGGSFSSVTAIVTSMEALAPSLSSAITMTE